MLLWLMSANPAVFLADPGTTIGFAVAAGVAAGLGWAALALFERRSWSYILVNSGYLTVSFGTRPQGCLVRARVVH